MGIAHLEAQLARTEASFAADKEVNINDKRQERRGQVGDGAWAGGRQGRAGRRGTRGAAPENESADAVLYRTYTKQTQRMTKEAAAETAEVDALEAQLAELRQDAGAVIVARQGRLQKIRLEYVVTHGSGAVVESRCLDSSRAGACLCVVIRRYEAMAQSLEADKERCNREILAMLDTLVEHKNYIETTLADLLTTVSSA